jgi:hypothetical protein
MLVGFLILLAGFVLWVGEKGNRLFLFPFAGRVTMVVGILVLAGGATLAGRRAALMLSALTVLGGLALYGIGVVFLEQLGTRLYQAGGLLTALVGLIAAFTVFRISQPDS